MDPARRTALIEALVASAVVTATVTAASAFLPDSYVATAVAIVFFGATWALVWRRDDACVERSGLSFGGLFLPGKLDRSRLFRAGGTALLWGLAFAAITFVPFFLGWRWWWHAQGSFALAPRPTDALNEVFGQFIIIALPEEAFYRGYLLSRLDDVWAPTLKIGKAKVGLSLLVVSVIFALGHIATIHQPARLAVFFPALVFGWLRARTGGVGASVVFHALCNVFSEALGRGYGIY